jgi:hypothetical protein
MLRLVVDAHRAAHRDDRVDPVEAQPQRFAFVQFHPLQRGAPFEQHVLEDTGRS